MNNLNALDILQACIDELNLTTKDMFNDKKKMLGIYDKTYDRKEYLNHEVEILFDLDRNIDEQQNNLICEYGNEFIDLVLVQDDEYNIFTAMNNEDINNGYITKNIGSNCDQSNVALAA